MNRHNPLQKLYEKHLGHLGIVTPLEKTICAFIKKNPPAPSVLDALTKSDLGKSESLENLNPWRYLNRWRERLAISLIVNLQETAPQYRQAAKDSGRANTLPYPFWDEFQLPAALRALNCYLSDLPIPSLTPVQLNLETAVQGDKVMQDFELEPFAMGADHSQMVKAAPIANGYGSKDCVNLSPSTAVFRLNSGAAPLESGGHWTWAEIPHVPFHAELGVLWCLLGHVTHNAELTSAAIRLAEWHLKTLDFHFFPFTGLFVQEEDACLSTLLTNNYLLFYAIAALTKNPEMEYVAERQMEYLEKILLAGRIRIHPLAPLLEEWIGQLGTEVQPAAFALSPKIWDPCTDLVGYRSPSLNVVCTLFGGKTGLGCLHADDIQIINYGPQRLPLSDCQGFGIEGGAYTCERSLDIDTETSSPDFSIRRQTHVAGVPVYKRSAPLFRNSGFSGLWIDAEQQFHQGVLHIRASFLGMTAADPLAFTFFVKAKQCVVNGQTVNSRSLARYQGAPHLITLHGDEVILTIESGHREGELQVIPLAGEDSFWSADFLLAYKIDVGQPTYTWSIARGSQEKGGGSREKGD